MMGWDTFAEKARMALEPQGGPLAVILPGSLEDAKRLRGEYWKVWGEVPPDGILLSIYRPAKREKGVGARTLSAAWEDQGPTPQAEG